MIPGIVSKLSYKTIQSAATIVADVDVIYFSNNAVTLTNIISKHGTNASQMVSLVPLAGNVAALNTGNIADTGPIVNLRVTQFIWNPVTGKWYENRG